MTIPEGFVLEREGPRLAVLPLTRAEELLAAGLRRPEELTRGLPRGRVARLVLAGGDAVVRAYRRGGLLAFGRSAYPTTRRFLRELLTTLEEWEQAQAEV